MTILCIILGVLLLLCINLILDIKYSRDLYRELWEIESARNDRLVDILFEELERNLPDIPDDDEEWKRG